MQTIVNQVPPSYLLQLLSAASGPLISSLGFISPYLGSFATFGATLFGFWFSLICAAPFGLFAVWRFVTGRSWALLLVAGILVALLFAGWLIPIQILRIRAETDHEDVEIDYEQRCQGSPRSLLFIDTCTKGKNQLKLEPQLYAHVMLVEWYAHLFGKIGGWTGIPLLDPTIFLLLLFGVVGKFAGRFWDRQQELPAKRGGGGSERSASSSPSSPPNTRKRNHDDAFVRREHAQPKHQQRQQEEERD